MVKKSGPCEISQREVLEIQICAQYCSECTFRNKIPYPNFNVVVTTLEIQCCEVHSLLLIMQIIHKFLAGA